MKPLFKFFTLSIGVAATTLYVNSNNFLWRVDGEVGLTNNKTTSLKNIAPNLLPDRLITVFGLECSGTTFLATTLAHALGKDKSSGVLIDRWRSKDNKTEVQHVSEPFGYFTTGSRKNNNNLSIVDVFLPEWCMIYPNEGHDVTLSKKAERTARRSDCNAALLLLNTTSSTTTDYDLSAPLVYPQRFFVNISSHLDWYRNRGVDATAVILIRDQSIQLKSNTGRQGHAPNEKAAQEQNLVARHLILQALNHHQQQQQQQHDEHVIITVSYETMMHLQDAYILNLYKELGINSTFVPEFRDGNAKYVSKVAWREHVL